MRHLLSGLVHHVLKINLIKTECATERVDDNLKPVLGRVEVVPFIEENVEDGHDDNHGVERGQSSHGGESSIVVDNHEDEEDENSGYKIHEYLQHQDQDVKRGQSFILSLVADFYNGDSDGDEGK